MVGKTTSRCFLHHLCHFNISERFTAPPVVNLSCSELFFNETCTKLLVNVTWGPTEGDTPESIQDRLQNCQATINCTQDEKEVFRDQVCA